MPASPTEFFGFSHRPFRGTPDPKDYVAIEAMDQELQRLAAAAAQGDGIAVLTAAPGAGKTLVCQCLRDKLDARFEAVVLSSSGFATRRALLQAVLFALGQSYESSSEQELRLSVLNYARNLAASREGIVLIVDEAHLLNTRLLEELRCLTNHSRAGHPLMRVVLCGQLPLEDALVDPALEALNYRITCHATLEPLSMHESARLVAGRLQRADRPIDAILTPETLETICRVSDGNPRCLVQLCDESLRIAAEAGEVPVDVETVRLALQQLKQLPLQWNESAIDQPQCHSVAGGDADSSPGQPWTSELSIDSSPVPPTLEQHSDVIEQPLGWSEEVCTVELGTDSELPHVHHSTTGWSSFEPESGWCPSGASTFDDDHDEDAAIAGCGQLNVAPVQVAPPDPNKLSGAASVAECHDNTSDQASPHDDCQGGFVELPVNDVYAALDARTGRTFAASQSDSIDRALRAPIPVSASPSRNSVREPIEDADPSGQYEPFSELSQHSHSDPLQRLDEVMATLSTLTGRSPVAQTRHDIEWFEGDGWQSAGDCRDFDVIEAGGTPLWDEHIAAHSREVSMLQADQSLPASADHQSTVGSGHAESSRHPLRRPYARLFSRARQQHS